MHDRPTDKTASMELICSGINVFRPTRVVLYAARVGLQRDILFDGHTVHVVLRESHMLQTNAENLLQPINLADLVIGISRVRCKPSQPSRGARWSSGIDAAIGARGRVPYTTSPCSYIGQVVNLSLSVAETSACPAASG